MSDRAAARMNGGDGLGVTSGLRRRLLVMLISPLVILALLNAWFDYRSADNAALQQDQRLLALVPLLAETMRTRSKQQGLSALEAVKVPCGAINNLAEVFDDPQVQAREMAVPVPHPLTDSLRLVASPMKLSATPVRLRHAPPLLGQHTDDVLAELGLDETERARLRARGVI